MASIAARRTRLQQLEKAARLAVKALKEAEEAKRALEDREEKRRRESDDEAEDEDEDEDEENSNEDAQHDGDKKGNDADDQYADEEEEGFDFDAKLETLEQERLRCLREATNAFKAFVTEFEACVKADNVDFFKQLHDSMRAKLPNELRHMIYSYLNLQGKNFYLHPSRHHSVSVWRPAHDYNFQYHDGIEEEDANRINREVFDHGTYDIFKVGGWLLNPEYVGKGLARDIADIWYSVNDFSTEVYQLKDLLLLDRTQTGLKPYELIRGYLSVHIPTTYCNGSNERAWQTTENEIAFLNSLYTQLSHLMLLKHKSDISIEIWLGTSAPLWESSEVGERRFYNIMESIRAPIYDLIHAGVKVVVNHTAQSSYRTQKISEEPLNYFRMSKEEWEAEKSTHGPDWLPSANFITKEELEDRKTKTHTKMRIQHFLKERWGHVKSIDAYGI